jgi:hypothetical protein
MEAVIQSQRTINKETRAISLGPPPCFSPPWPFHQPAQQRIDGLSFAFVSMIFAALGLCFWGNQWGDVRAREIITANYLPFSSILKYQLIFDARILQFLPCP